MRSIPVPINSTTGRWIYKNGGLDDRFPRLSRVSGLCLIIALSLFSACSDPNGNDGGCSYQSFPGSAVFTELNPVTGGFEAYFDFTLSDSAATVNYLNNGQYLHVQLTTWDEYGRHSVFSSDWLGANSISVGATVPAEYHEIRSGACSPAYISILTITGSASF